MRITTLIYDDIDNLWLGGGGARRTYEVARRLATRHQVTVITGGYPGATGELERDGVRYLFTASQRGYAASRLAYMREAALRARKLPADLTVEVFSAYNPLFSPLWARGVSLGVLHNIYRHHAAAKYGSMGRMAGLIERPALAAFRNYLAVSHGLADELQATVRLRGKRLAIIPNGIDEAFFGAEHASRRPDYILYLGRIDIYQKGLDTLLAALYRANTEMRAKAGPIRLLIAGGGPEEQVKRVRDLIAGYGLGDAVEMTGRVSQAEAAALLLDHACRFLVMPSRHEAWGMAAAEAGAAGVAVLGFDISGLREAAPATAHGLLLKSPSPATAGEGWGGGSEEERVAALSEGLVRLWCDRELEMRLGEQGRARAASYSWDAVAAAEERYYLSLVGVNG